MSAERAAPGPGPEPEERYLELLGEGRWEQAEDLLEALPVAERERLRALSEALLREFGNSPADSPFQPGARVGDLVLVRELGRGAMGMVWEARQPAVGRSVAVKFLYPVYALFDRHQRRFRREARAAARLRHPGIALVHDLGEVHATPFIVQELVPGGRSLRDELSRAAEEGAPTSAASRLPGLPAGHAERMARLFLAVAEALEHAHGRGVLHRDLKPANLLLTPEGGVKLVDFGLASLCDEATRSGQGEASGTPLYMAPELTHSRGAVRAGEDVDGRVDVYALGVSLLEALALPAGLPESQQQAWRRELLAGRPPDPRRVRAGVPADLAAVALAAAEPRADRRIPSAAELAAELRRVLAAEPVRCLGTYRRRRALWRLRRFRAPLAAAGIVLVLVLARGLGEGPLEVFASPALAEHHVDLARGWAREGDLDRARRHLERARFAWRGDAAGQPLLLLEAEEMLANLRLGDEVRAEERIESRPGLVEFATRRARGRLAQVAEPMVAAEAHLELGLLALLGEDGSAASEHLERGLALATAGLGEHDPTTLELRRARAESFLHTRRYDEAALEFEALHAIRVRNGGPTHVSAQVARADRGRAALALNHADTALEHLVPTWPVLRRRLGPAHAESLRAGLALARARVRRMDLAAAETTLAELEGILRAALPPGSRPWLEVRSEQAALRGLLGDAAGAEALQREIWREHLAHRGPEHPTTLHARADWALGAVSSGAVSGPEALELLLGCAAELLRVRGVGDARARLAVHRLARELGRHWDPDEVGTRLLEFPGAQPDRRLLRVNLLLGAGRAPECRDELLHYRDHELGPEPLQPHGVAFYRTYGEYLRQIGSVPNAGSQLRTSLLFTPLAWTAERADGLPVLVELERTPTPGYTFRYGN